MTESNESEQVINALKDVLNGQAFFVFNSPEFQTMLAHKLIVSQNNKYHITKEGYEVIQLGSFSKWLLDKQNKEAEIHTATLATAKAAVDAAKWAKGSKNASIIAAVAAVIAAIAAIVGPLVTPNTKSPEMKYDSTFNLILSKLSKVDSLTKVKSQKQVGQLSKPK